VLMHVECCIHLTLVSRSPQFNDVPLTAAGSFRISAHSVTYADCRNLAHFDLLVDTACSRSLGFRQWLGVASSIYMFISISTDGNGGCVPPEFGEEGTPMYCICCPTFHSTITSGRYRAMEYSATFDDTRPI
jgi:hypothetical protein